MATKSRFSLKALDSELSDFIILKREIDEFDYKSNSTILRSDHLTDKPWYLRLNKLNITIIFGIPLLAFYGLYKHFNDFKIESVYFAIFYYFFTGFGITAGYHRLWSHISYEASYILQVFLMLGGTGALQGSIKFWCLLHRAHHRWTDTDLDPYNAKRGFIYSHIGWLIFRNIHVNAHVNIVDLKKNKLVRWQHKNYQWFGPFMALIFPTIICYIFFSDIKGGFYLAGALRLLFIHHATWCVNSVAHWYGEHTFDDTISPRDSIFTGLLTLGEGYHNFHHEFPHDYRNGIHWYDYDPTKWFINITNMLGISNNLGVFPYNEILRGEYEMKIKKLVNEYKNDVNFGININTLPSWDKKELNKYIKNNDKICVIINNIAFDVTDFVNNNKHPGGINIIKIRNGKDVTKAFNGLVYNHTNAARNLLAHLPVAKIIN